MFRIKLSNGKKFDCTNNQTIFEAATQNNIFLDHSCLTARCRKCILQVNKGNFRFKTNDLILSKKEKENNFALSCNTIPESNLELNCVDIGFKLEVPKIIPAKIDQIKFLNKHVIKLILRTPPTNKLNFKSGQYVNIISGDIKRSYSIANSVKNDVKLEFYIKKYKSGLMSNYLFNNAKVGDLLRIDGPYGTFCYRESSKNNIIFLATGTGIAPVISILNELNSNILKKDIWIFNGNRNDEFSFYKSKFSKKINYFEVYSQQKKNGTFFGYVQDAMLDKKINLEDAQIYACGSDNMIKSTTKLLNSINFSMSNFITDSFLISN